MPDRRKHRGPHPADRDLFAPRHHAVLRTAVAELSWLLERGYSDAAAVKLVGDRHQLATRQRVAVRRSSCGDGARASRRTRRLEVADLAGATLYIDGFNCVIIVESALSGGLILVGRDGVYRDLASVHGSYRKIAETEAAVRALGAVLERARVARAVWLLDRPVSNSGRLRALILAVAEEHGWRFAVELDDAPEGSLKASPDVVATGDAVILDHCQRWVDLPAAVIAAQVADAWVVDLGHAR